MIGQARAQSESAPRSPSKAPPGMVLEEGRNCWRSVRAPRVAPLIDASSYFSALSDAIATARHSIWVLAWDIHSQVALRADVQQPENHCRLLHALDAVARREPSLQVRILSWDYSPIFALEREPLTHLRFRFETCRRVHMRRASDHPNGACHHHKIVVIDDALAFVGSTDLTVARWDERTHTPHDPRRRTPAGVDYDPYHDVQLLVDGQAAASLGELARGRWRRATGELVDGASDQSARAVWPARVPVAFHDIPLAIARTQGAYGRSPAVREVERSYLDAIEAARHSIYIENQYLTSQTLEQALAERLADPLGPDVLIVTPHSHGRGLEHITMGALRCGFVERLRRADRHNRLWIAYPVVPPDQDVYVHAKVMIVDDEVLRVGSANLTNRSMALDTECDVLLQADSAHHRRAIEHTRNDLLSEHLGCDPAQTRRAIEAHGSLVGAARALGGGERGLRTLEPDAEGSYPATPNPAWMDPDGPIERTLAKDLVPRDAAASGQRRLRAVTITFAVALFAAGMWVALIDSTWGSVAHWRPVLERYPDHPWGPVVAIAIFAVATTAFVPVTPLIVACSLVWPPWQAGLISLAGSSLGAMCSYTVGRLLRTRVFSGSASHKTRTIGNWIERRGVVSVIAMRMVPAAPFAVVNVAAGAARVRPLPFALGTPLGMMPGIVALSWASSSVLEALRRPDAQTILGALIALALLCGGLLGAGRILKRRDGYVSHPPDRNDTETSKI